MSNWIYPFKGRNASGSMTQNFVWKNNNIFIMDNHRAALWCWLQNIDREIKYNIFHIDAHYDTLDISNETWVKNLPDLQSISLDDYLNLEVTDAGLGSFPMIRWDNYLSLYFQKYSQNISDIFMATHNQGCKPAGIQIEHINSYNLPQFLDDFINDKNSVGEWVINIDLDYFVFKKNNQFNEMFSEEYFTSIFEVIRKANSEGKISTIILCLSPECSGGWGQAEKLCKKATDILGVEFELPA